MLMMVDEELPVIDFNATMRCDGCGAQAYTLARKDGWELLFCGHHAKDSRQKLFDTGWEIVDDGAGYEDLGYEIPELV